MTLFLTFGEGVWLFDSGQTDSMFCLVEVFFWMTFRAKGR